MIILLTNCEISCFRRGVNEVFALLGCDAALIGSKLRNVSGQLPTFRDGLSVPYSRVSLLGLLTLKMGPVGCPKTSVYYTQSALRNIPEERRPNDIIITIIIIIIIVTIHKLFTHFPKV